MFEEFRDRNVEREVAQLNAVGKDFLYLSDLSEIEISDSSKKFIICEIDDFLNNILNLFVERGFFDIIQAEAKSSLKEVLGHKEGISSKIFINIINQAVSLRLNFLLRPSYTLSKFVFADLDNIDYDLVFKKLGYFTDYGYLINELVFKLDEQRKDDFMELSKEEFENTIHESDYEFIFSLEPNEFVGLVEPIYSFFNIYDEAFNENVVPAEALMIFFDDKNMQPLVDLLKLDFAEKKMSYVSKTELLNFIYKMIEGAESDDSEANLAESMPFRNEFNDENSESANFNIPNQVSDNNDISVFEQELDKNIDFGDNIVEPLDFGKSSLDDILKHMESNLSDKNETKVVDENDEIEENFTQNEINNTDLRQNIDMLSSNDDLDDIGFSADEIAKILEQAKD